MVVLNSASGEKLMLNSPLFVKWVILIVLFVLSGLSHVNVTFKGAAID
jgi:hypothetical protein